MTIQCKKTFFSDEKQANYYLEKLKKTSARSKIPTRAYLCEKCFNWHLTAREETGHEKDLKRQIEYLKIKLQRLKNQMLELRKEYDERGLKISELNSKIYNQKIQLNRLTNY